MSEINNLSDIKENFDTIKSLLNSIRAQDVLNAGDISKVLNAINGKLERIDQEDNLELMNNAISSMKQSLDERHSVLISKFSTIESLFSNILKNSVDSLKSSEIKELFDIIATNLSVFSREVVSQKDTLTDIILRIEALRADDGTNSTIVANLDVLKRELERFNNGFESIIVNLGDNFSTIVRSLDDIRAKCSDNHYDKDFENLYMTSNSILSSIQVLDKKSVQMEETLANILAKCDSKSTEERISELFLQNKEIYNSIGDLAVNCNVEPLYQKIDNASALISGLKDILQNVDTDTTNDYISRLSKIETAINKVLDENDFGRVRQDLESALNQIANTVSISQNDLYVIKNDLETVASNIKALDIHVNFQNIQSSLTKSEVNIKTYISDLSNKFSQLSELTFQRTIEDIKQKIDTLASEIKDAAGENLEALSGSLIGLKSSIEGVEASSQDTNNQFYKNVSERLGALENTLAGLLNNQSVSINNTGRQMTELSSSLNLKFDSISADFGLAKDGINSLQSQIDSIINSDYAEVLADIKSEILRVQSELLNGLNESSQKLSDSQNESLNAGFDTIKKQVEDCQSALGGVYNDGLIELRTLLNNITSSLIDIVSYVSVKESDTSNSELEKRFTDIEYLLKDYSSDSVEKINAFIKDNIEKINSRLTNYDETSQSNFQNLATKIESNSTFIREDIKKSYDQLAALKNEILDFKEYVIEDLNNNPLKVELVDRVSGVKNAILEKLNDFEKQFVSDNLVRWEEFQEINSKVINKIESIPETNRSILTDVRTELVNGLNVAVEDCIDRAITEIKSFVEISSGSHSSELQDFSGQCEKILAQFKNEIPNISEIISLDDKLEALQDKISELLAKELDKTYSSISSLLQSKMQNVAEGDDKEQMLDMLFQQEKKVKTELAGEIKQLSESIKDLLNNANANKADIINRVSSLEAVITRDFERSELSQAEIVEKLESFGNLLFKLAGNGSISISDAINKIDLLIANLQANRSPEIKIDEKVVDKIDELSIQISNFINSQASVNSDDVVIEKINSLSSDLSNIIINESSVSLSQEILDKLDNLNLEILRFKDIEFTVQPDEAINSKIDELEISISKLLNAQASAKSNEEIISRIDELSLDVSKLVNNESATNLSEKVVNRIDDLGLEITKMIVNESSVKSSAQIIDKLDELSIEISQIIANEASVKSSEILAELLEKTENSSKSLFEALQAISANNSEFVSDIQNSLSIISHDLIDISRDSQDKIFNEVVAAKSLLTSQLASVDKLYSLCSELNNNDDKENIVKLLTDFKSEIITQMITIFNQITFSTEQEEIINFIKVQQEDLKNTVKQIMNSVDNSSKISDRIVNEFDEKTRVISAQVSAIKDGLDLLAENDKNLSEINLNTKGLSAQIQEVKDSINLISGTDNSERYTLLNVEADITKLRLGLGRLKEGIASSSDLAELNKTFQGLEQAIVDLKSELPKESIDYLKKQLDLIAENVKSNDLILSNIFGIKEQLESIDRARELFRADVESAFNKVISTVENSDNTDDLKKYIQLQLDSLYNGISEKFELFSSNPEVNSLITAVMAKQDANLAHIVAHIGTINNTDVIAQLEVLKTDVITQVINAFNQISFEADAIEIKSLIDEKYADLKLQIDGVASNIEKISSTQSEIVEDYTNALTEVENKVTEQISDQTKIIETTLNDKLEVVKAQLKSLQESSDGSTYSLSDIEEDLTKLRLIVSDIKSNQNKRELETVTNAIDTVISQLQDLKEFIPADKINDISENSNEVLDLLEGLALDIKNIHSTQDDIIGYVKDGENSVVSELKTTEGQLKSDILMSLDDFANEIKEFENDTLTSKLTAIKSDIITQILSVVSQISFVEEQEEIISQIDTVKNQLNVISSGDPDTIGSYSLQDIETDVAKLRVALDEIKSQGRGEEIDDLIKNLSQAADTLEYLKTEIPNHEISEVRDELEKIANDIISISIRTNKLLISSDESYKDLKDNIDHFRSIMGDVDERTKNLYEEVGMDKLESQVTSIRDIVGRQEVTNQVFNEVFEYLAEWIDSTGEKIGYITDKLNNKDDINEIKLSLEELRNSTSVKFEIDAQSEKIDAMESKLNVIIESLEPTFQNQQERMQALERKVNRIVDFFEPAFTQQQERINKLEGLLDKILDVVSSNSGYGEAFSKLDKISEIVAAKDDTQLVKKINSFEKQITKLNKNVEKLALYVNKK